MSSSTASQGLQALREDVMAKGFVSGNQCYVDRAQGARVVDVDGREYIDFAGGIAVMNVGHSHPKVVAAIKRQAEKFTHTCFMVLPYEGAVRVAENLCAAVPGNFPKRAILVNSGAEAVENAVKIARYATKRQGIICFENAFHGRTYLGMSLTSKVMPYKFGFGPFVPEIYRMPYAYCYRCRFGLAYPDCGLACAEYLREFFINHAAGEQTAALIAEPVLGEGGFVVPPKDYFSKLKAICEEYDILFIADEIQTGMGRTGRLFAMEHFNMAPDLTTVAKSLAAGMPLSAVVGKKEIMDSVHAGGLGGTYGGSPIACAAALAVFDIIATENLLARGKALGEKLRTRLEALQNQYAIIGDVRGLGPMMAMELVHDRETKQPAADLAKALVSHCIAKGLIILSCGSYGNVIRLLMPLVITDEELDKGLAVIEEGLAAITR